METTNWRCRCISTDKRVWLNWLYCKQAITGWLASYSNASARPYLQVTFCRVDRSVMAPCTVSVNINEESIHCTCRTAMLDKMISCLRSRERKYFMLHWSLVPRKEATDCAILAYIPVRVSLIPQTGNIHHGKRRQIHIVRCVNLNSNHVIPSQTTVQRTNLIFSCYTLKFKHSLVLAKSCEDVGIPT